MGDSRDPALPPIMVDNRTTDGEEKEAYLQAQAQLHHHANLTQVSSHRSQFAPTVRSARSYADGHGTYVSGGEQDDGQNDIQAVDIAGSGEKAFEVTWDGPDDPMNPKNLGTGRKWLIVMTLAFGSLCVTCTSSLYTTTYGKAESMP